MEERVEQLTRERNHFAQKLVAAQQSRDQHATPRQDATPASSVQRTPDDMQTNIVTGSQPMLTAEKRNRRLNPFFIDQQKQEELSSRRPSDTPSQV